MRKSLSLLLALALVFSPTLNMAQSKKSLKGLKSDLSRVKGQKSKLRRELGKIRKNVSAVRGDIRGVDERLDGLEDALKATVSNLSKSKSQQKEVAGELEDAKAKYLERKGLAEQRLANIYMRGEESFASVIVGSKTLGDMAERKKLLQLIVERDRELFDEVKALRARMTSRKRQADAIVNRIDGLVRNQKSQQFALKDTRNQKHQLLVNLKDKQGDIERLLRQLESEENSIESRIAAYQARPGSNAGLTRPSGRLLMPVAGGRLGSPFGMRRHPILGRTRMHKGVDIGARSGTPIRAAADGVVISSSRMNGYGNVIILNHGGGVSTLYAHCSRLLKSGGARVKRGEKIALVGSTGLSTAPHLHFEVRINGKAVNPKGWL